MKEDKRRVTLLVTEAYLAVLRIPHKSPSRTRLQRVMAGLRDELARLTHQDPELVQNLTEVVANAIVARSKK